jgi:hypothetical protein
MGAVLRMTALAARLLPVAGALVLLAGCGEPPRPLPTAPPETFTDPPSASPSFTLPPTFPTAGMPTAGVPTAGLPAYPTYPAYPGYPVRTIPPPVTKRPAAPPTSGPPPAPKCRNGPTGAQVIAVVRNSPGIPKGISLTVSDGPYCASSWQFTKVATGADEDQLMVVTNGPPAALKLVEAGQDVCSDKVESTAPPGIRVRACGS